MHADGSLEIGGVSKERLRRRLEVANVKLNTMAEDLFRNPAFTTADRGYEIECVEISVTELGFPGGATMDQLIQRAAESGLGFCPLETGPHLRLKFTDQAEGAIGQPATTHCAPPGSLTILSQPLSRDNDVPKGFYLRKIDGELWLRGFTSSADHLWSAEDRLILCRMSKTDDGISNRDQ